MKTDNLFILYSRIQYLIVLIAGRVGNKQYNLQNVDEWLKT